jgi:uncharacterized hydrophobic protein (TIGR00271 family)
MGVEYVFTEATGRDGSLAQIPVPAGAEDAVLDRLYHAGLPEDTYTAVTDADRATVPNADELSDQFVERPKGDRGAPLWELRERAADLTPERATYLAFAVASAVVAVGGLLLDSAIVIVGAMVIAPFAGSTLSASVGTVVGDRGMTVNSAISQILGLIAGYVGAVVMSVVLRRSGFVPTTITITQIGQVSAFTTPNLLIVVIAISAGLAGALALATDLPVSIAGVAVAAAIVPAVATAGIGTVWGRPIVVLGAVVLLFVNVVFINVTAYLTLVSLGYRSSILRSLRRGATVSLRTGGYAVVVVLFAVVLALTAIGTYQHLVFERNANQGVQDALADPRYDSLELADVNTDYDAGTVLADDPTVTVTVSRTDDGDYDRLADQIRENVTEQTDQPVTVQVRFVDYDESEPTVETRESGGLRVWTETRLPVAAARSVPKSIPQTVAHPADLVVQRPDAA